LNVGLSLDLCCFLAVENKQEKDKEVKNEIRNEKKQDDCGIENILGK
jgi:hypothetical protein